MVTGAAGGMGGAVAARFASRHPLILVDVDGDRLAAAAGEHVEVAPRVTEVSADLAQAAGAERVLAAIDAAGGFATFVNAAGLSTSMAGPERIIEVNLIGTARLVEALGARAGAGSVGVCIASMAAYRNGPDAYDALLEDPLAPGLFERLEEALGASMESSQAYDLSKRGVVLLCERLAAAWGARGARLVSVSPGLIATGMGLREQSDRGRDLVETAALGRIGEAAEVASVVEFLAGPGAAYVSGCDLLVDGGAIAALRNQAPADKARRWNGWGRSLRE